MDEKKKLKKQFILHISYNMIVFAIIFIIFGIFIFLMLKNIMFSFVDKQLFEAKKEFSQINEKRVIRDRIFDFEDFEKINSEIDKFLEYTLIRKVNNPRITLIFRNENDEIINENDIEIVNEFREDILFNNENYNEIYTLKLNDKYNYRGLNFVIDSSKEIYAQLLINVDTEISLINNYTKIIAYGVIICIILSGFASFILSKKTLKPIEDTLNLQTEFVQNVSHELRTPLTIIQAKQELLLQEPNSKIIDKSEDIILALNETKRLSKLIKDLMMLIRGSNKNVINLDKEDIYIDEFIKNISVPYIEIAEAQNKKIILDLNFQKDISIDTNMFHQLMIILLDNAIKYTEENDEIKVNTILKDNKCIIEIIDTGIGISDEGINRAFERFYREDKARNRKTGGTGLGLSIASMIVNAHNGTIKVSHNTPKGTIFTIKLNR